MMFEFEIIFYSKNLKLVIFEATCSFEFDKGAIKLLVHCGRSTYPNATQLADLEFLKLLLDECVVPSCRVEVLL